jgi:hypothetical protein
MLDDEVWNMKHLITLPAENFRLFCCIANSLEDSCLPRIGAANDEDTKTPGSPSEVFCFPVLSFNILHWLDFGIGRRHLSMGRTLEMVEMMKKQDKRAGVSSFVRLHVSRLHVPTSS